MVKIPIKAVYELKLYNTYYICNNLAGVLKGLKVSQNTEQNNVYYIENWDEYTNALKTLRTIPIFKDISDKLYELIPVFIRSQPRPSIDTQTRNNLISANNNLICRIDTIIELYTSMNIPEKEKGIDVKIPNCQDLKEYIKYLNDIDFVFSQCPYLLHKDETIKFSSVDVGSNWLTFVIEVSAGATGLFYILNNLAKIVDKAMILKSHYCSIKEQEEALKSIQLKSDLAKSEKEILFRIPCNEEYTLEGGNWDKIKRCLSVFPDSRVELFATHSLAIWKYRSLGLEPQYFKKLTIQELDSRKKELASIVKNVDVSVF